MEVTQLWEPYDHLPKNRDIIGPANRARREALVREVPPAKEPVESATDSASLKGTTGERGARRAPPEQQPSEANLDVEVNQ